MNVAELFVKILEKEGITHIFGVPGEENLALVEAIRKSSIQLIVTRHEQAAGFMAATWGRLSGKAGVALSTLGPGATNLVTAAAYAQLGAMPLVMITGQKPLRNHRQGLFQIVDVVNMMRPLTKYTNQIVSAETLPARVREAFRCAQEERPGAAHLELPEDIASDSVENIDMLPIPFAPRSLPHVTALEKAALTVIQAKAPLLMIGPGACRNDTSNALRKFIVKLGIPFFTTQMGKGVISEDHPLWMGNATLSEGDFVHQAIDAADVIINVGHDVVEKSPFMMDADRPIVIHINFSSAIVDTTYFPQFEVIGDITQTVEKLTELLKPQSHWNFNYFKKVRQALLTQLNEHIDDNSFPMHPVRIVHDVRSVMPDNAIICLDNGLFKIWFARYYRAHQLNTILLDNALATMGAGLPSAIATKMLYPDRKVLAICGDGGFMMNAQELETVVRLKLNLVILLLRDNAYGMIRWKQEAQGYPDFAMTLANPDFVAFAQAHGAYGHRPTSAETFVSTLQQALEISGVHLIDLEINYLDSSFILNKEIPQKSAALLTERS